MQRFKRFFGERTALRVALAVCLVVFAVLAVRRLTRPQNPYSFERLTQEVTLVCRETGEEFTMPRGRVEQMLWDRPAPIDPSVGITNPNTGLPTLFPKNEWETMIDRINADRKAVADASGRKPRKTDD